MSSALAAAAGSAPSKWQKARDLTTMVAIAGAMHHAKEPTAVDEEEAATPSKEEESTPYFHKHAFRLRTDIEGLRALASAAVVAIAETTEP